MKIQFYVTQDPLRGLTLTAEAESSVRPGQRSRIDHILPMEVAKAHLEEIQCSMATRLFQRMFQATDHKVYFRPE